MDWQNVVRKSWTLELRIQRSKFIHFDSREAIMLNITSKIGLVTCQG